MHVVVIGAGLIGISTAYFLGRLGHEVTVLDRREGPGLETSFANGGMLTPSQAEPWNTPGILLRLLGWLGRENAPVLLRPRVVPSLLGWGVAFLRNSSERRFLRNSALNAELAFYSLRVLRELRDKHGLRYDGSQCGTMKLYRDRHSLEQALKICGMLRESGVDCEALDGGGVAEREPALAAVRARIAGGIFYRDDESGDAYAYCRSLAALAAEQGARFRYGVSVAGLRAERRKVSAIATSSGEELKADSYVLAAGSYSPGLLRPLGLRLPVQPVKGYSVTLDVGTWAEAPRIPVIDDGFHIAVTPLSGKLRVAGTAEFCGYDTGLTAARIRNLLRFFTELYPGAAGFAHSSAAGEWAGLRPYTCDGVPVLGRTDFDNLYLNTGHGHLGWTMAAGSGKLVADIVAGNEPFVDPRPYRLDRF
ncbi:MAG: D-amino acid dehydrogenase [Gammaproteobacteria bacterium]|nr:D-amino acid dehydrogenase [Gammaproteobacteria bacterium]